MHFPVFIELECERCLVVGGGSVASRKALTLADFGAQVQVVSPRIDDSLFNDPRIELAKREFVDSDVDGMSIVVAATDCLAVNRHVSEVCRAKNVQVNVVDDPANCTFIFPAIVRRGPFTVAVSSGGKCPVAAKLVRDNVGRSLDDDFLMAVERLGDERERLKKEYPDPQKRKRMYEEALKRWND